MKLQKSQSWISASLLFSLDLRFSLGFSFGWDEKSVDARGPGTHKSSMGWESFVIVIVIVIDLGFVVSESIRTAESEEIENANSTKNTKIQKHKSTRMEILGFSFG